jgi:hypothetical protein
MTRDMCEERELSPRAGTEWTSYSGKNKAMQVQG